MRFLFFCFACLFLMLPTAYANDQYSDLTRATLSKLFWHMDKMDIANDRLVDNFLLINRCDIYKEHFNDDFKWHEIRQKARASLIKNKDKFSRHIEIIQPIDLERYDVTTQRFPLFSSIDTKVFELKAVDEKDWPCQDVYRQTHIWGYPYKAILTLASPFQLSYLSVPLETAKKFSDRKVILSSRHTSRVAYIVYKIKVFDVDPYNNHRNKKGFAGLSGVLERVQIYGDQAREMLLYEDIKR